MNSLGKECDELKLQYDACFNYWFTERFLKGDNDESMCAQIFKVYQQCVKRAIREQKIDARNSMTSDYNVSPEYENPPPIKKQSWWSRFRGRS